jgi:hypothetical protein
MLVVVLRTTMRRSIALNIDCSIHYASYGEPWASRISIIDSIIFNDCASSFSSHYVSQVEKVLESWWIDRPLSLAEDFCEYCWCQAIHWSRIHTSLL